MRFEGVKQWGRLEVMMDFSVERARKFFRREVQQEVADNGSLNLSLSYDSILLPLARKDPLMGKVATSEQIRDFLKRFKQTAGEQGKWWLVNRRVNLEALASLGIAVADVKTTVLALTEVEYRSGPEVDRDGSPGEIWTFETDYLGKSIYIKLKLDEKRAKCLSFHPSGLYK